MRFPQGPQRLRLPIGTPSYRTYNGPCVSRVSCGRAMLELGHSQCYKAERSRESRRFEFTGAALFAYVILLFFAPLLYTDTHSHTLDTLLIGNENLVKSRSKRELCDRAASKANRANRLITARAGRHETTERTTGSDSRRQLMLLQLLLLIPLCCAKRNSIKSRQQTGLLCSRRSPMSADLSFVPAVSCTLRLRVDAVRACLNSLALALSLSLTHLQIQR